MYIDICVVLCCRGHIFGPPAHLPCSHGDLVTGPSHRKPEDPAAMLPGYMKSNKSIEICFVLGGYKHY